MLWKCSPNSQTCQNWFTRHAGSSSVAISVCDSCWNIWWLLNGAAPLQTLYLASALVACLDELHDAKGLLGDALQPRCGVRVWFLNLDTNGARFHALCRKLQKDFEEFDSCAGNSCHAGTSHHVCMIPSNLNLFQTCPYWRWKTLSWVLRSLSLSIRFPRLITRRLGGNALLLGESGCLFAEISLHVHRQDLGDSAVCGPWNTNGNHQNKHLVIQSVPGNQLSWSHTWIQTGKKSTFESHSQAIVGLKLVSWIQLITDLCHHGITHPFSPSFWTLLAASAMSKHFISHSSQKDLLPGVILSWSWRWRSIRIL